MFNLTSKALSISLLGLLLSSPVSALSLNENGKISQNLQNRLVKVKSDETLTLFIYFKDKGINIDKKLLKVKSDLSPVALQRRIVNRGIDNVVGFNDLAIDSNYLSLIKSQVSKVRHQLKTLNAISVEVTPDALKNILKYEFVQKIDLVNRLKRMPEVQQTLTTDNSFENNSFKNNIINKNNNPQALDYGASFTQNDQINVPAVHDLGYSGNGIVIAIFDSGFNRLSHESFSQMTIADSWDFVNNDSDVGDGSDMGTGSHGTNTLSTVGGYSPGNLIGPAYNATYYLAKTENTESELHVEEDNWCAAAEWADTNGAHIITSSLGYTGFDSGTDYAASDLDGNTAIVTRCADLVAENGIIVINSAGNSGPGVTTIGAPSDGDLVLAVGAVTSSGALSSFSSVGPSSDGRIKPDVLAMGSSVRVASAQSDTGYSNVNGTSFSCPLTAGVAALVLEANTSLTASQVRDILRNSASQTATPDNSFGHGIVDTLAAVEAAIDAASGSVAPNAAFALLVTSNTTVNFTSISTDSNGSITSHAWDFGDGNTSSAEAINHTYAASGTYTVGLTVMDDEGLSETVSRMVTVTAAVVVTPTPVVESSSGGGSFGLFFLLGIFMHRRKVLIELIKDP